MTQDNRSYKCYCGKSELTDFENLAIKEWFCEVCPTVKVRLDDGTEVLVPTDRIESLGNKT